MGTETGRVMGLEKRAEMSENASFIKFLSYLKLMRTRRNFECVNYGRAWYCVRSISLENHTKGHFTY